MEKLRLFIKNLFLKNVGDLRQEPLSPIGKFSTASSHSPND